MSILHRLRHLFGWNTGTAYSWFDDTTGRLMTGFRCDGCGSIECVSASRTRYGNGVLGAYDPLQRRPHACDLNRLEDGSCAVCGAQKPWLATGNATQSKERPCTCHPDDLPPRPCPRKYALDECRLAHVLSLQGTNNVVR